MSAKPDTDLISAARAGDGSAYAELFERYEQRIYTYAYGIAGNTEDARDIAQDAFIRVFEALPRSQGELNFSAYLYRTAHNVAIDTIKERARFVAPDVLDVQPDSALLADPERVTLLREQQEQTWRATFALSESQRAVLALRELHEMSYQDIAEVLEMPRTTVGVTLSRARLKFKEAFRMSSVNAEETAEECRDMLGLLSAYLDDELTAEERARVDEHLEACAFCRLALEEMTEASRSYRALLPLLPPAALGAGVLGGVDTAHAAPQAESIPGPVRVPTGLSLGAKIAITAALLGVLGLAAYLAYTYGGTANNESGSAGSSLQLPAAEEPGAKITPDESIQSAQQIVDGQSLESASAAEEPDPEPDVAEEPVDSAPLAEEPEPGAAATTADTEPPSTPDGLTPQSGAFVSGSTVTLAWNAVDDPSGVTYTIEIETYSADRGTYIPAVVVDGLSATTYSRTMASTGERWRVFAVDGAGNSGGTTSWHTYSRFVLVIPIEPIEEPPTLY